MGGYFDYCLYRKLVLLKQNIRLSDTLHEMHLVCDTVHFEL